MTDPHQPSDVPSSDREDELIEAAPRQEGPSPPDHPSPESPAGVNPQAVAVPDDSASLGDINVRSSFLQEPLEGLDAGGQATPRTDSIPGYEIIREIHRGGQGVVYQALQKHTKRKVAIKVMREGPFASHRDKARFEREIEVLGQLNHPSIVGVHDSGTAAGSFYFVMDYISGEPLEVWMASKEHTIEETLRLFTRICEAVNAAHLRGVIHRDLKPGNIRIDAQGEPHVLDFGLAKVATASDASVMTVTGQFMGSLPWASPEQAEAIPEKIDVRTDVYSLGVILYQMLTGKFPYEVVGNMRDVLDRIIKTEPTKPSTIRRQINDEVETIVLKCLSKERDRRYQTAGELARDIGHYLNGEPIEAKRDSFGYMLRKQLRRYKAPVTVAAGFVVLLVLSLAISTALWRRATTERNAALAARQSESEQRAEAVRQKEMAERRAEELRRTAYFGQIALADSAYNGNETNRMKELLEAAPVDLRGWEWHYLNSLSDRSLQSLRGHDAPVRSVAFSPDGRRIASGGWDNVLRVWDADTGVEMRVLRGHNAWVRSVAFSPDGKRIISGSDDETLRLWNAEAGVEMRVLRGHQGKVSAAVFSPDGRRIVSGSEDSTLKIWDAQSGAEIRTLRGHTGGVYSVVCSPDGRRIVSGGGDAVLKVWDAETGVERRALRGHESMVRSAAFSPDGRRIVSGSEDATLRIWDAENGAETRTLRGHKSAVYSVAFSPDGRQIASGSWDMSIKVWDAETATETCTLHGHNGLVFSVQFSPDGRQILSGSGDKTAKIWDAESPSENRWLRGHHESFLSCVAVSRDGRRIVSSSYDKTVRIWAAESGVETHILRHTSEVHSVAISPDGRRIVSGSRAGTLRIWDADSGIETRVLRGHSGGVRSVVFSPDGLRIVSGGLDNTVRIWDSETGNEILALRGHNNGVCSVAVSPDGRWIVSGSNDQTVRIWAAETGAQTRTLRGHERGVSSVAFSPDGRRIVSASYDYTLRVWDSQTGVETLTLRGHNNPVSSATFSPDGRRIVSGGHDKTVRVWDAESGTETRTLRGPTYPVYCVVFSPDGRRIVSGGGGIMVWDSIPYPVRYREHQASLAAHAQAQPLVTRLLREMHGEELAIDSLRSDPNLTAPVREAALELVFQSINRERNAPYVQLRLARELQMAGKSVEADRGFREALEMYRKSFGDEDCSTAEAMCDYAHFLARGKDPRDYGGAESMLVQAMRVFAGHPAEFAEESGNRHRPVEELRALYGPDAMNQPEKLAVLNELRKYPYAAADWQATANWITLSNLGIVPSKQWAGEKGLLYVLGPSGLFKVARVTGDVSVSPMTGQLPGQVSVSASGRGLHPFAIEIEVGGRTLTASGALLVAEWDVKFFVWSDDQDPMQHQEAWQALVAGKPAAETKANSMNFTWGTGSPAEGMPADRFGTAARASFDLPAGRYDVWTSAEDGIRVWIDGNLVIDDWTWSFKEDNATIELKQGRHDLRIEHFQGFGNAQLQFGMEPVPELTTSSTSRGLAPQPASVPSTRLGG